MSRIEEENVARSNGSHCTRDIDRSIDTLCALTTVSIAKALGPKRVRFEHQDGRANLFCSCSNKNSKELERTEQEGRTLLRRGSGKEIVQYP